MSILEEIYKIFIIRQELNKYLIDYELVKLTEVSKILNYYRKYLEFHQLHSIKEQDVDNWHFHKLTNVKIHKNIILPQNTERLVLCQNFTEKTLPNLENSKVKKILMSRLNHCFYYHMFPKNIVIMATNFSSMNCECVLNEK